MVREGTATVPDEPIYTNRIHQEDAAGMALHLLREPRLQSAYFGCDREAASYAEVLKFLAELTGSPMPQKGESSRRSNKRINSARILRTGYRLRYPTFREGYRAMAFNSKLDSP